MLSDKKGNKITVIMPVYNMQLYIAEAIESFLSQTLKDIELLCIDDCSTDNSKKIVERYALEHKNINIYSMVSNSGVGEVRRKAMQLARGEYIAFLDADDKYWRDDALEVLYDCAIAGDCDVCGGLVSNFSENTLVNYPRFRNMFSGNNAREYIDIKFKDVQDDYYFQGFIFKREHIERNHVEFPAWRCYEDPPFLIHGLHCANAIRAVNIEYYGHRFGYKELRYSTSALVSILEGIKTNLIYAEQYGFQVLFDKTFCRLNKDFFMSIMDSLKLHNENIENNLHFIEKIGKKHGYSIDIFDYLLFVAERYGKYDEFRVHKKCEGLTGKNNIVLYGAGNIGKMAYREMKTSGICNVMLWIDTYKKGDIVFDTKIGSLEDIGTRSDDYDCVLIGIDNVHISGQVRKSLMRAGIGSKKIIEWVNL